MPRRRKRRNNIIVCWRCREEGHISHDCTSQVRSERRSYWNSKSRDGAPQVRSVRETKVIGTVQVVSTVDTVRAETTSELRYN